VVLSRGSLHASGRVRWEDARIESIAVATNTPPNGAFRGFGAPQTIWAIERHLDARSPGSSAGSPRSQASERLEARTAVTATGQVLRISVAGAECLEKALAASDYERKRAKRPVVEGRKARGIGGALFMHGAGFTGSGERYLKGKVAVDLLPGGRLRIRTGSTDIGQGTETVFRQIVADAAGVPLSGSTSPSPAPRTCPTPGPPSPRAR
jgi:CO/xanthine dehydrogenase Mo-binding subunit